MEETTKDGRVRRLLKRIVKPAFDVSVTLTTNPIANAHTTSEAAPPTKGGLISITIDHTGESEADLQTITLSQNAADPPPAR